MTVEAPEFAAQMAPLAPFTDNRRVLAAVSGGPDSMGLALLLKRWGDPVACIVDHGLRHESAEEAALTQQRLARIGVPARILRANLAPGPRLAERAREARYALLLQACRDAGCADLVLAHHARDQAETIRIREARGSGPAGLAGMAALSYRDDARLLRPLLGLLPDRLRATLRDAGVPWVEDPSNQDLRTPRARLRESMGEAAIRAACAIAAANGAARRQAEGRIAAELAQVALQPEGFALAPAALGPAALSALIWTLSGAPHPPSPALLAGPMRTRTVHGVVIRPAGRLGAGWLLAREPAAVAPPTPAHAGLRWDGRFRLTGRFPDGLAIGALGADAARLRDRSPLPALVLRTLPALRRGDDLIFVPHLAFPDAATCLTLNIWFCPARAVAGAPFVNLAEGLGGAYCGIAPHVGVGAAAPSGTGSLEADDEQFRP